ncbi:MAG: peptidoglycan editing factor PgeF [Alphaproteobacteria bacterium]
MQNIKYIESQQLKKNTTIKHAFFTKNLLGSTSKYFLRYPEDNEQEILNNKSLAMSEISRHSNDLIILNQIHSNNVLVIDKPLTEDKLNYDAIVTNVPKIVLGIRTADCVPILFYDPLNKVISAAHAGWRGAFSGIIQNTISEMLKLGAKEENILASIGPCIRQESYEVDQSFYTQFLEQTAENDQFFILSMKDRHYMFDLPAYVKLQLNNSNVNYIEDCEIDSLNDENFFSYRRAKFKESKLQGEILSVITLE